MISCKEIKAIQKKDNAQDIIKISKVAFILFFRWSTIKAMTRVARHPAREAVTPIHPDSESFIPKGWKSMGITAENAPATPPFNERGMKEISY